MAFTPTKIFAFRLDPSIKSFSKSGPAELQIWRYENGGSDTGGNIVTGGVDVLFAGANDESGANPVQVRQNHNGTATELGTVNITTTADSDGYVLIVVNMKK